MTVTEGEPVRYRINMSRRTSGAVVESSFSYKGKFVRNPNSSVVTGVSSHGGKLYWEKEYETLDDAIDEENGSFTVTIGKPDADQYDDGEAYTIGSAEFGDGDDSGQRLRRHADVADRVGFRRPRHRGTGRGARVPGDAQCGGGEDGDDHVRDAQRRR